MQPEQIPGSLFVLVMAALGLYLNEPLVVFLLGLGCACGWQFYNPNPRFSTAGQLGSLIFWTGGTILLAERILL